MNVFAVKDARKFQVQCDAGDAGQFTVGTDALSVAVGQRMPIGKQEEMWDSIHIVCKEQPNGSLTVEVLVCHPDWEEPRRIVVVYSRPQDNESNASSLWCDFEQQPSVGSHRTSGA